MHTGALHEQTIDTLKPGSHGWIPLDQRQRGYRREYSQAGIVMSEVWQPAQTTVSGTLRNYRLEGQPKNSVNVFYDQFGFGPYLVANLSKALTGRGGDLNHRLGIRCDKFEWATLDTSVGLPGASYHADFSSSYRKIDNSGSFALRESTIRQGLPRTTHTYDPNSGRIVGSEVMYQFLIPDPDWPYQMSQQASLKRKSLTQDQLMEAASWQDSTPDYTRFPVFYTLDAGYPRRFNGVPHCNLEVTQPFQIGLPMELIGAAIDEEFVLRRDPQSVLRPLLDFAGSLLQDFSVSVSK